MGQYLLLFLSDAVVEMGVAAAFGYRHRIAMTTVVLANLITYPLLTFCSWLTFPPLPGWPTAFGFLDIGTVLFLEGGAVVLEWALLVFVFRERVMRLFALSAAMNAASLVGGPLVFRLCYGLFALLIGAFR